MARRQRHQRQQRLANRLAYEQKEYTHTQHSFAMKLWLFAECSCATLLLRIQFQHSKHFITQSQTNSQNVSKCSPSRWLCVSVNRIHLIWHVWFYDWKGSKDRKFGLVCVVTNDIIGVNLFVCERCSATLQHVACCEFYFLFIFFCAVCRLIVSFSLAPLLSFALSCANVKNGADAVAPSKFLFNSTDVQRKNEKWK